jgi:hypothetical protein
MQVHDFIEISTCHVTEQDMALLEDFCQAGIGTGGRGDQPIYSYNYDKGAFVVVPDGRVDKAVEALISFGFSKSFGKVITLAMSMGFYLVRLDCDGEVCRDENLDILEW